MDDCPYWSILLIKLQGTVILHGINSADKTCFGPHYRLYSGSCNEFEIAGILDSVFKTKDYLLIFKNVISKKEG